MTIQPIIIDKTTGNELWTATQCADHCTINTSTWRGYVNHRHSPQPVGHLDKRTPLWNAAEVKAWHTTRPGSPIPNHPTRNKLKSPHT